MFATVFLQRWGPFLGLALHLGVSEASIPHPAFLSLKLTEENSFTCFFSYGPVDLALSLVLLSYRLMGTVL